MLSSIINKSLVIESDSDHGKWVMSGEVSFFVGGDTQ